MANPSIYAAFERMWQHIVTKISTKSDIDHEHSATEITSGVLPIEQGGTGNGDGYIRTGQKAGTTIGTNATAEGYDTTVISDYSHAEGYETLVAGSASHAEGCNTKARGPYSHAEGYNTEVTGSASHAEGQGTKASGDYSHAEGCGASSVGAYSHAEGFGTTAGGNASHVEGSYTISAWDNQHVQGKHNIKDLNNIYAHIVGNGELNAESNAHTIDWDGNANFAGDVYVGNANENKAGKKLATEEYVSTNAAPSGYGLGMATNGGTTYSTVAQVDALTKAGWYEYYSSNEQCCGYLGTYYGGILVIPSMWDITQFFFCRDNLGAYLKRTKTDGVWSPWEWVNPPFNTGNTEYRTTERYFGKPVYQKAFDMGSMVTANTKTAAHGVENMKYVVSVTGQAWQSTGTAFTIPLIRDASSPTSSMVNIHANTTHIMLTQVGSVYGSNYTVYAIIKYTKTTD